MQNTERQPNCGTRQAFTKPPMLAPNGYAAQSTVASVARSRLGVPAMPMDWLSAPSRRFTRPQGSKVRRCSGDMGRSSIKPVTSRAAC